MEALALEVHALGKRMRARVSRNDLQLAQCLKWTATLAEIIGRGLVISVPHPIAWVMGTLGVAYCLSIEAQLNHTIMHGAFARLPNAGRYTPKRYETIAIPFQSATWGAAHHIHHARPSVLGEDPDTIHGLFRVHEATPHRFWHRLNAFVGALFTFEVWAIDYDRFLKKAGKRARSDRGELAKLGAYVGYQLVFFGLLAGRDWGWMVLSTVAAISIRNVIFTGLQTASSVGARVSTLHAELSPSEVRRLRGDAFLRFQIESSKNFRMTGVSELLCGGLHRHIEHHLFPALPPNLLGDASKEVQQIAARHGVRYEEHVGIGESLRDSIHYLHVLSRPSRSMSTVDLRSRPSPRPHGASDKIRAR